MNTTKTSVKIVGPRQDPSRVLPECKSCYLPLCLPARWATTPRSAEEIRVDSGVQSSFVRCYVNIQVLTEVALLQVNCLPHILLPHKAALTLLVTRISCRELNNVYLMAHPVLNSMGPFGISSEAERPGRLSYQSSPIYGLVNNELRLIFALAYALIAWCLTTRITLKIWHFELQLTCNFPV